MKVDDTLAADESLSWILYVLRDDGDYDRVAIFTAEAQRSMFCECNERDETLAYHMAHELAALLEYDNLETRYSYTRKSRRIGRAR